MQIIETAIHRSEAHIGNRIQIAQGRHHQITNMACWNFSLCLTTNLFLDLAQGEIDLRHRHWALAQCPLQTRQELLLPIGFPPTIRLDHHGKGQVRPFEGGKALATGRALPPSTHGFAIIGDTRVDDAGILMRAKRAVHL